MRRRKNTRSKLTRKNRKHITYDPAYDSGQKVYPVNAKTSGLYVEILERLIQQYEVIKQLHNRVFVLRFDLHLAEYSADNGVMTRFMRRLLPKVKRRYALSHVGYGWVREQVNSVVPHYHCVLFLDAGKVRSAEIILQLIQQSWLHENTRNHVSIIPAPFKVADSSDRENQAVYRFSYLAKVRSKGKRPDQTKDYSCSRLS
ncbi:YagK/YfjJ domain-containing protein [Methylophaga sp.]|uniref:YagK/YfjJ domain-containing protein n=1 Tax=Methylophaga sp. TaxID=2024840 RepID=UPI003A8EB441